MAAYQLSEPGCSSSLIGCSAFIEKTGSFASSGDSRIRIISLWAPVTQTCCYRSDVSPPASIAWFALFSCNELFPVILENIAFFSYLFWHFSLSKCIFGKLPVWSFHTVLYVLCISYRIWRIQRCRDTQGAS